MARAAVEDPLKVFRFAVYVDGFLRMGFSEVTGVEAETEAVEYREGGDNETPRKSAGLTKYNDITMKRGQVIPGAGADDFLNWMNMVYDMVNRGGMFNAENYRKDFTLYQFNAVGTTARTWAITQAWPKKYKPFSDLNGTSNDNSIEELVIAHEGFEPA